MIIRSDAGGDPNFANDDVIRKYIQKICKDVLDNSYSDKILHFIFLKEGMVTESEIVEKFPQFYQSCTLRYSIRELLSTLEGNPYFVPDVFQGQKGLCEFMRPKTIFIFMEEAQKMLEEGRQPKVDLLVSRQSLMEIQKEQDNQKELHYQKTLKLQLNPNETSLEKSHQSYCHCWG